MQVSVHHTAVIWKMVTHLGSASLMLPIFAITAKGLWLNNQRAASCKWAAAIIVAVVTTAATKILFFGWGIGVVALDFTGISGHTMLATSVLPVLFGWLFSQDSGRSIRTGAFLGILLGFAVGVSRVILVAHSMSEVIAGWAVGLIVSGITLNAIKLPTRCPWFVRLSPLLLLLSYSTPASNYLLTHQWEVRLALLLSGHDKPYTRHHLNSPMRPDGYTART